MRFEGNGNVKIILHLKGFHFTVKGIDFPFDRVLHVLPNEHGGVKYFPNFILIWNKHSIIHKMVEINIELCGA